MPGVDGEGQLELPYKLNVLGCTINSAAVLNMGGHEVSEVQTIARSDLVMLNFESLYAEIEAIYDWQLHISYQNSEQFIPLNVTVWFNCSEAAVIYPNRLPKEFEKTGLYPS